MLKKAITVIIGITLVISLIFNLIAFIRIKSYERTEEVKGFYFEYEKKLNNFVEICLENKISSINIVEHQSIAPAEKKIGQYYVYSFNELSNEIISEMAFMLELFEEYKVDNIWCGNEILSISIGRVGLHYEVRDINIDRIKKNTFYDEVRYLDENWFIGIGDSVL